MAIEEATGLVRETVTNAAGVYTLPNVPPGTYAVTISSPGFQPHTRSGVVVTAQTVTRVDAVLSVGEVKENVTVSAETVVLQTDRADVRFEIGEQSLNKLPVPIGRNYQMLFVTLPGVSPPQTAHSFAVNPTRALAFTVNGLQLVGVSGWIQPVVNGAALLAAVSLSAWALRLRSARLRGEQLRAIAQSIAGQPASAAAAGATPGVDRALVAPGEQRDGI